MAELLPCPFCGGEAVIIHMSENHWVVACENEDCPIWYGLAFKTREKAEEWWNTRTPTEKGGAE